MSERPPILLWMQVVNSDAQDSGRVGMLVDILDREDDPDLKKHFVLEFEHGEQGAYAPDEVVRFYVS